MSAVTQALREELARDAALQEAIKKALDFSEAYAALERAEKIIESIKEQTKKGANSQ